MAVGEEHLCLVESLEWTPETGLFLLDLHLARLRRSADALGFPCDAVDVRRRLDAYVSRLGHPAKVRLNLARTGDIVLEDVPLSAGAGALVEPLRVGVARTVVAAADPLLRHKTTRREPYREALASRPDCDDVLLVNERGEITEASSSNVVFVLDGQKLTPPVSCGLLPGTFRERLLGTRQVIEQRLERDALTACAEILLVNSVRRWRRAVLV